MTRTRIEGDGHVHVYPRFDLHRLIADALDQAAARATSFWLLITDREGDDGFRRLADVAEREAILVDTDESASLRIERHGRRCYVIRGRQVVSTTGVEVLGIGLAPEGEVVRIRDGSKPTRAVIESFLEAGGAAVLPWGMGKWLGGRGREVRSLWESPDLHAQPRFLLGDVAQRCWPWPRPRSFGDGSRVLSGSDALPVEGAEGRIGRFGFRMEVDLDPARPARSWLAGLDSREPLTTVGRRESPLSTIREQWAYRRGVKNAGARQ